MSDVGLTTAQAADATATGRLPAVRKAANAWTGQLVDLPGRNSLLYYRDLKVGTLPLDSSPSCRRCSSYVVTDGTNSTKEPDMPTLMVRYEIDDNAVDDVVKGRDRLRGQ